MRAYGVVMFEDSAFASMSLGTGAIDYAPHNKGVTPVFFVESVIDHAASEKAGRAIYIDMERVRINIAGDQFSSAVHPVDTAIIDRFEEAYAKWKRKGQVHVSGTPLVKWPLATPRFIKEMEYLNIFSVDDLAAVADVNLDRFEDGRQWRDKAAAWLRSAKDGALAAQMAAENHRLREQLAGLAAKVETLMGEKPAKARRKPMSPEQRVAAGARLKAGREAKKAGG
jgi:hypothetical protein